MKKPYLPCEFLLFVSLLVMALPAFSDPIPMFDPVGGRSVAMGGATAALTGSPMTTYHNPAGMVWQVLTGGIGIQPVRFNEYPQSWWGSIYNRNSDLGFPISLVMAGWRAQTEQGNRRNFMVGVPLAYKLSPYSPAAVDIKWAFERTPEGNWIAGIPMDFGFMARSNRGANIGWVTRNVTIGRNRFETLKPRTDFGIAYESGAATVSYSSSAETLEKAREFKDRFRMGIELSTNPSIVFRGGYVQWDDGKWYTGGIGLRTFEGGMYFDYAVICDHTNGGLSHFIQYIYMVRPRKSSVKGAF